MRSRLIALITVSLVVAACGSSDDEAPTVTTEPPQAPTTTAAPSSFTNDEALALSSEYFDAFNGGDADALLATLTPEVELSEKYSAPSEFGNGDPSDPIDRVFFEQHMVWATAQGSSFTTPDCVVTELGTAGAVTVVCEFGWLNAPEQAAEKTPAPTVLTMVVTPDGISQLAFEIEPQFGVDAFERWVVDNHPNDTKGIGFGDWDSVADAEQGGRLRAQYVAEWIAELEANG